VFDIAFDIVFEAGTLSRYRVLYPLVISKPSPYSYGFYPRLLRSLRAANQSVSHLIHVTPLLVGDWSVPRSLFSIFTKVPTSYVM
jgi:hypothetical protein